MKILGKEPLVWIGIIVSLVLAVATNLNGQGVISDATTGQITDATKALGQILVIIAPLITALIARPSVTSVAQPSLPQGTSVTVVTPGDAPNTTTTL